MSTEPCLRFDSPILVPFNDFETSEQKLSPPVQLAWQERKFCKLDTSHLIAPSPAGSSGGNASFLGYFVLSPLESSNLQQTNRYLRKWDRPNKAESLQRGCPPTGRKQIKD